MISVRIYAPNNGFKNVSVYEYLAMYAAQAEKEVTRLESEVETLKNENAELKKEITDLQLQLLRNGEE